MTAGLGVVIDRKGTFFPMKSLKKGPVKTEVNGSEVTVAIRKDDSRPGATLSDGSRPVQYFMRWYGFSLTYPRIQRVQIRVLV